MKRKVIFVGGTAYSGSTFFHMTLANDPQGFATGEIRWLFYPNRPDHIEQMNNATGETRELWRAIRDGGVDNVYETIFNRYPQVRFIVDSTKRPHWINYQSSKLAAKGIETRNVLIWKTPLEFASSTNKRKRLEGWDAEWVDYHRLYVSLIPEWRSVNYKNYTSKKQQLKEICNYLGIPYFEGKHEYWEKEHHSFGGNYSARFHLHQEKVAQNEFLDKTFDKERMDVYRKIYYSEIDDAQLKEMVQQAKQKMPQMEAISKGLKKNDILQPKFDHSSVSGIQFPKLTMQYRWLKYWIKSNIGHYKFNHQITI